MDEVKIRYTISEDSEYIKNWLMDEEILKWFPMYNEIEVNDAVRIWISYAKINASLTAEIDKKPVGTILLYVQSFEKIKHHALFAVIVDKEYRNKKIGTKLIEEMIKMAKDIFNLEFLNLEVYEGNPAIRLYEKFGFEKYGIQKKCLKDNNVYYNKILMQKYL